MICRNTFHTSEPAQPDDQPAAMPIAGSDTTTTESGSGICTDARVMSVIALAVTALWQRMRA